MSFDNPRYLYFLFLFVIFIPIAILRYRKGRAGAELFAAAAPSEERESLLRELRLRMIFSEIFFLFFIGFLVIALAGPRWGLRIVADYRRGVDVILAFDVSRSMDVQDCTPYPPAAGAPGNSQRELASRRELVSRLDRGAGIANDLAAALGDVRLGVAIGKGRGVVAVPLTYDSDAVLNFLSGLDSMAVTGTGTNLESLIDIASASFQDTIPSRRGIILFSDGEALSGSFQAAAEKARKAGISLSSVGLGSDEGGPVPVEKSPEAPDGFLLAADGMPVTSARQSDSLLSGAEKTGGVYIDGSRNDAAKALADYVNSLSAESRLSGYRREANPRWRIFVIAAMACLAAVRLMGFSRRRRYRSYGRAEEPSEQERTKGEHGGRKGGLFLSCLFCVFLVSSCDNTQGKLLVMEGNFLNTRGFYTEAISSYLKALNYDEAAPYANYGLASAYFDLEENGAALERYKAAEKGLLELKGEGHGELKYRICYNMGIIYFEMGEYTEAAQSFRGALELDGSRIEAKRNLELSLLTINRGGSPQALSVQQGTDDGNEDSGGAGSVLFDYLKQKEQDQWKSREWTGESDSSGPDY